ncbi:phage holin family protein [Nocardioidaceae bacterium]|nr:phage holin family protein [Nocardioidaceae bacterium]
MRILIWLAVHGLALGAAVYLVGGIRVTDQTSSTGAALTVLVVGAILGAINATIGRALKLLGLPFIILSLGLVWLLINGAMLKLAGFVAGELDLGFRVGSWGAAIIGALVVSVTAMVLRLLLPEYDEERLR